MSELPPEDLRRLAADDALLDALGRGEAPVDADPVAGLLSAFRAGLDQQAGHLGRHHSTDTDTDTEVAALPTLVTVPAARGRRWSGRAAAITAVGGVLLSGTGVAAALTAQPGDLLYGVRRAVVGPVDDSYRKNADALIDRSAKLSGGPHPITAAEQAQLLDHAAALVPGIKDPGRKKATVKKIASARVAFGLPSQAIATDGAPPAAPATAAAAASPSPSSVTRTSPSASSPYQTSPYQTSPSQTSPSPDGLAPTPTSEPTASPTSAPSGSASSPGTGSDTPSASASPSRRHRRPPPPSPSSSPSSAAPAYSYGPPPKATRKPKPSPTPSPTFVIG